MKRKLISIVSILGTLAVIVVAALGISFYLGMQPDSSKEAKVKAMAEAYLEDNFQEEAVVYGASYDNMGNHDYEYAAKVRIVSSGNEFIVYENENTGEIIDTYSFDERERALRQEIDSYVTQYFDEETSFFLSLDNQVNRQIPYDDVVEDNDQAGEFKPIIRVLLEREKQGGEETSFEDFSADIQQHVNLDTARVIVEYQEADGETNTWSTVY